MNKVTVLMVVVLLAAGGYVYYSTGNPSDDMQTSPVSDAANPEIQSADVGTSAVKEFTMTSWMDKIDGKMAAHFSLNEIRVKKGDTVKIHITNTAGTHDFTLDEFGIKKETPLNQVVDVEFVADKAGTFEYYCSKYNHRALGQRGNLIVE